MSQISSAISHWSRALSETSVISDAKSLSDVQHNLTGYRTRDVKAILRPKNQAEVVELVKIAQKEEMPLYPFSTGCNWGLGSKLPIESGCTLVDLGQMTTIHEVNEDLHYAIIEPGVTQQMLSDYLMNHHPDLMLNVTGSMPGTSIVGNIMERGTGFIKHRSEELRGVEIVLGTSEVIRTGFWHNGNDNVSYQHYKYGIGPSLHELFPQSNFGIVTKMVINLIPRPEKANLVLFDFHNADLGDVINLIRKLYHKGLLQNVTHIGDYKRLKLASLDSKRYVDVWTAMTVLGNSNGTEKAHVSELKKILEPYSLGVQFINKENLHTYSGDPLISEMYKLHTGSPSPFFTKAMFDSAGEKLTVTDIASVDNSRYGMQTCLPILPMEGVHVQRAMNILQEVTKEFGLVPAVTLNPMNDLFMESVISLYFDKSNSADVSKAQACNLKLHNELFEAGFRFYRLDIENMKYFIDYNSDFWNVIKSMKEVFDPNHIIAPMRYNLI